jgi:hypothetical protein
MVACTMDARSQSQGFWILILDFDFKFSFPPFHEFFDRQTIVQFKDESSTDRQSFNSLASSSTERLVDGVDFYCRFLPAKLTSQFLLPISSRQIDESRVKLFQSFDSILVDRY